MMSLSYTDAVAVRLRWMRGAEAEYHGMVAASHHAEPIAYSTDDYEQRRWETGFADGKALLMQDQDVNQKGEALI